MEKRFVIFIIFISHISLPVNGLEKVYTKTPIDPWIINGEIASRTDFPFLVSIQIKSNGMHYCGGSLIAPRYVLTAAHCTQPVPDPDFIQVWIGGVTLSKRDSGITVDVEEIFTYKDYNDDTKDNDIGIIKLKSEVGYTDEIKAVEMTEELVPPDMRVSLAGWGYTREDDNTSVSDNLLSIEIKTTDFQKCKEIYAKASEPFVITENMICAHFKEGTPKDPCQGDSGGPLIYEGKQIGIVSAGIGCAREEYPGIYANVIPYADWIKETINGASPNQPIQLFVTSFIFYFAFRFLVGEYW